MNYYMTECLRNCYRHEINDDAKEADNNDNMVNNKKKQQVNLLSIKQKWKKPHWEIIITD